MQYLRVQAMVVKRLEKGILNDDGTMKTDAPLAGDQWNTPKINWRYYTSVAKPTLASHAQETSTDVSDDEYPSTQNASRTLCQATKRGTLVGFLNAFEVESEKHTYHRNIVSTEQRAQLEYERMSVRLSLGEIWTTRRMVL